MLGVLTRANLNGTSTEHPAYWPDMVGEHAKLPVPKTAAAEVSANSHLKSGGPSQPPAMGKKMWRQTLVSHLLVAAIGAVAAVAIVKRK